MNTKQLLVDATKKLLESKTLEEITVAEIVGVYGFSRTTFYSYFKDKYDLINTFFLEYIENQAMLEFQGDNYNEVSLKIGKFIFQNRDLTRKALSVTGQNNFRDYYKKLLYKIFYNNYVKRYGEDAMTEEVEFQLECVADMQVHGVKIWVDRNCEPPIETFIAWELELIPESFRSY